MKGLHKSQISRITIYLVSVGIFVVSIFAVYGFKVSFRNYYSDTYNSYQEARWNSVETELERSIEIGRFGLVNASNKIQVEVKQQLDMDRLKESLSKNLPYPEFDLILRNSLQKNIYTQQGMDQNRNSIFVITNGRIIANYSHDKNFVSGSAELGSNESVDEAIANLAYNKTLCKNALKKIENQYKDMIVWQYHSPKDKTMPMYDEVDMSTLKDIFMKYGVNGLKSYTILIPVYITDYGNIFGEYDTPETMGKNNKLVLVQKLNIGDCLYVHYPEILNQLNLNEIKTNYELFFTYIKIFECILYISIITYICIVVVNLNKIISEEYDMHGRRINK